MSRNNIYENLVFEGGGVKGAAYAGCVQVLEEHQILHQIKRVAGTSAGSITAALLAIGAGKDGLTESIMKSNFNDFLKDRGWIFGDICRIFRHYGIHSGDGFTKIFKKDISKYTQNPDLTFAQLDELVSKDSKKFKHLSVVASNITTQKVDVFDSKRTPNLPIWKAVRCSMSIPVVFEPFVIKNNYYMDGGLGWIYPIDIYDKKNSDGEDKLNPKTLGFYLEPQKEINHPGFNPPQKKVHSLKSATIAMYDFLCNSANSKHIRFGDKNRTVFIDDLGISATDFSISEAEKKKLIESGRKATEAFLKLQGL